MLRNVGNDRLCAFAFPLDEKSWMAGTRPAMTGAFSHAHRQNEKGRPEAPNSMICV
jgi:hypothetical protein